MVCITNDSYRTTWKIPYESASTGYASRLSLYGRGHRSEFKSNIFSVEFVNLFKYKKSMV